MAPAVRPIPLEKEYLKYLLKIFYFFSSRKLKKSPKILSVHKQKHEGTSGTNSIKILRELITAVKEEGSVLWEISIYQTQ